MKRFGQIIVYGLPVLLWTAFLVMFGAGERGNYQNSLHLLQSVILHLSPQYPYQLDHGMLIQMSMYQLNAAFRALAHVFVYAVLTVLVVRMLQAGRPKLRPVSLGVAALIGAAYMTADEVQRLHEADRHAKAADLVLNLIGVALVLGGTILFFALKDLERRLAESGSGEKAARRAARKT